MNVTDMPPPAVLPILLSPRGILSLLAKEYVVPILRATFDAPTSVDILVTRLGIPVAVAYRRVKELVEAGFLTKVDQRLNAAHRPVWTYQSNVAELKIKWTPTDNVSLSTLRRTGDLDDLLVESDVQLPPQTSTPKDMVEPLLTLVTPYTLEILRATQEAPKYTLELVTQLGIPPATAHRRVNELVAAGLLAEIGRPINAAHRRAYTYQLTMDGFEFRYAPKGGVSLNIVPRTTPSDAPAAPPTDQPNSRSTLSENMRC